MTGQTATIPARTAADPAAAGPAPAARPRLLSGDRPTGRLHLGHYLGSISNRLQLQHQYESFIIVADLHMLTTRSSRA
ncbi:MAG: hypothetical protein ACM32E_05575, partial [Gemmatimonadota bacterium]